MENASTEPHLDVSIVFQTQQLWSSGGNYFRKQLKPGKQYKFSAQLIDT